MLSEEIITQEMDDVVDRWFEMGAVPIATIDELNKRLALLSPRDILMWALITFPKMHQTTSFGISGCVIIDMLKKLGAKVPIIFIDTLHHFPETIELAKQHHDVHVYRPLGANNAAEFARKYGDQLWKTSQDAYDTLTKVEPAQRAYSELGVEVAITGRRRSQQGERGDLQIIEQSTIGPLKLNPLAFWTYDQVWDYTLSENVAYNPLIDLGYKSIGDVHSTTPVGDGDGERSGRWKDSSKTECGLHRKLRNLKI